MVRQRPGPVPDVQAGASCHRPFVISAAGNGRDHGFADPARSQLVENWRKPAPFRYFERVSPVWQVTAQEFAFGHADVDKRVVPAGDALI
jgi:hypothetical protein